MPDIRHGARIALDIALGLLLNRFRNRKSQIMLKLVRTRNEDRRHDFLQFIGWIAPGYLSHLSHGFRQGYATLFRSRLSRRIYIPFQTVQFALC